MKQTSKDRSAEICSGCKDGLNQDYNKKLSQWFASRVDSRWTVRMVALLIEKERNHD